MPHSRRSRSWSESKRLRFSLTCFRFSDLAGRRNCRNFKCAMELLSTSFSNRIGGAEAKFGTNFNRSTFNWKCWKRDTTDWLNP